jgi:aminopeptidase N
MIGTNMNSHGRSLADKPPLISANVSGECENDPIALKNPERTTVSSENLTRAECAERSATVVSDHYEIHLDLTEVATSDTFRSHTIMYFEAKPGASTWIDLLAPEIISVNLNDVPVTSYEFDGARLQISGLAAENRLEIVANCAYSNTGEGLHKFVDPADNEIYLYSQFEIADARRVFACFDQPDLKATYTFTVDAPAKWKVFSNTYAEKLEMGENTRHHFARTKKMSTYITAIVAGDYYGVTDWYAGEHGTYPLGLYCRKSLSEHLDVEEFMLLTKQGFEFFEREFGVPYPFEKYDQIIVPEFNAGAMENAGCVTFYEGVIYRGRATDHEREFRSNTILHEMAHMWFGNLVTMKWWDDIWLNESFAEWASYFANNAATRYNQAWTSFMVDRKLWAYREDQMSGTHPIATDMVDLDTVEVNFDGITYAKGASTLRQLVAFVGEADFLKGVHNYFVEHAWGNTELKDLLSALEAASGRDLSNFTGSWLKTAGVNLVRADISVDAAGNYTNVAVLQEPPAEPAGLAPELRKHRMAIGLYNHVEGKLVRTERIEVDVEGARTEVSALVGKAQPALLLLNDDDLTFAKIRLDEKSLATAIESLGEIPASLPRALIWSAAWDMTRDGQMSTSAFLDLVIRALPKEDFIPVVQRIMMQTRVAAAMYSAPAKREQNLARLADAYLDWTRTFEAGSDTQFAAAKNFITIARTEEQIAVVQGLLNGSVSIEGLKVDADFRWMLINRLAVLGRITQAEIDTEAASDVTAAGKRNAASASAALPDRANKQRVWDELLSENDMSNEILGAVVAGFMPLDQADLVADFIEPYFAMLSDVWSTRSNEIAQTLTNGLFPAIQIRPDVVERTNQFLATAELPFGCKRLVGEGRDGLVRALNAQAADL